MRLGKALHFHEVNSIIFPTHTILNGVKPFAGLVWLGTVGQVTTCVQAHAEDRIARLQHRIEHTLISLAAGIRLHIGESAIEQLLGPLNRQLFRNVHKLAATVISLTWIAFSILVRQHRSLSLQHGVGNNIL